MSKETADLLAIMGKSHWIIPRSDKVYAKGKGEMQTYWMRNLEADQDPAANELAVSLHRQASKDNLEIGVSMRRLSLGGAIKRKPQDLTKKKFDRLCQWNFDVLKNLLGQVEERRKLVGTQPESPEVIEAVEKELSKPVSEGGTAAFDEVVESIEIATFNAKANRMGEQRHDLSSDVQNELLEKLLCIQL